MASSSIRSNATQRKRKQRSVIAEREKQRERDARKKAKKHTTNFFVELDSQDDGTNIREEAMRHFTQFRAVPHGNSPYELSLAQEMSKIRDEIKVDLTNHEMAIDPAHFIVCSSCGHSVQNTSSVKPRANNYTSWFETLQHKTYRREEAPETHRFCPTCANSLRKSQVPFGAKCRGWVFDDDIPGELAVLNRFERQLICLRLPCVYIWRAQGGFGQYGCRGAPVSFSNPVADLATTLPRYPSRIFCMILENGQCVDIDSARTYQALCWLQLNNPLYKDISIDFDALQDIRQLQNQTTQAEIGSSTTGSTPGGSIATEIHEEERCLGTQGPLDPEGLEQLSKSVINGVEDTENFYHGQLLLRHMLRPFTHRRKDIIPSYDACSHLESYFPVLFPYGRGGPTSTNTKLGPWVKHALSVFGSRFSSDVDFIFFVYSVLKRKRLTGLATCAPIRDASTNALLEVRDMLSTALPTNVIAARIDVLLRSGTLNASFEILRGSPAFWAALKRTSWAYLTRFGPCQLFLTISAADLIDPYVYCQINPKLTFQQARALSSRERADLLAGNPVAATTIFHRRIQSIFNNFLFGETKPFGETVAYLGRIEQQSRHSPHLHLLLWLTNAAPEISAATPHSAQKIGEFIELFCTALLPGDELSHLKDLPPIKQKTPPPKYVPLASSNFSSSQVITGPERHEFLSRAYNKNIFNGCIESNRELRGQIMSAQLHHCNSYCRHNRSSCRFYFPFPLQPRASVASRKEDPKDSRCIALAPRSNPNINSTHPLLTAMCHANTDVTVITGSSIPESMYVCSYAVKAEKNPLFDTGALRALRKLKNLDSGVDDRKLLGIVARSSSAVRTVGAQEAVDFLIDNPLTFSSAKVQNVNTIFLLQHPSALSEAQKDKYPTFLHSHKLRTHQNILSQLDIDDATAVPLARTAQRPNAFATVDGFFKRYMLRPVALEELSASEFHEQYHVRRLRKDRVNYDKSFLLLRANGAEGENTRLRRNKGDFIVEKRKVLSQQPVTSHILNVPSRGKADDDSPLFAAAALALHVPFRSVSDLLGDLTLTEKLRSLLDTRTFPKLNEYATNSHDLANALATPPPHFRNTPQHSARQDVSLRPENNRETDYESDSDPDEDEVDGNPLIGLPPLIAAQGVSDPMSVTKEWDGRAFHGTGASLQLDAFKAYVKKCKTHGLLAANRSLNSNPELITSELNEVEKSAELFSRDHAGFIDPIDVIDKKRNIFSSARNHEQERWLEGVLSYLQVYYSQQPQSVPQNLRDMCKENHPLFTNAPGGCGKSWLLAQVEKFLSTCVPSNTLPVWAHDEAFESSAEFQSSVHGIDICRSEMESGRLGRVAVFAPSGVAAGNAKGFTFHNGLRCHKISYQHLRDGVPPDQQAQLVKDFALVLAIVIDEYSMAAFLLIGYLDRVARSCRPAFSHIPFGGIPVIITGDGLQLPVVGSYGLLSGSNYIPQCLQDLHQHCTLGVFSLELSESVRQQDDLEYANILARMRLASSTEEDVSILNSRWFNEMNKLYDESDEWESAPVLSAKNMTVDALSNAATLRNGNTLGTFNIRSMPIASRSKSLEHSKRAAKSYFNRTNQTNIRRTTSTFTPAPVTVVYPGMPIMLRTNICPSLGLSNGSIGKVLAVIHEEHPVPPHESKAAVLDRFVTGFRTIPSLLASFPNCYRGLIGAMDTNGSVATHSNGIRSVLIEPQSFERVRALPISAAHAITMHKSQSLTIPYCIIDPRDTFCTGALYVAFSRAPSLSRIALISPVSVEILNRYAKQVAKVLARLKEINDSGNSLTPFVEFISRIEGSVLPSNWVNL